MILIAGLLLGPGLCAVAMADESDGPWSGKAALGYLATSGNSDNANLNAAFSLGYDRDQWHHSLDTTAIGATTANQTTAEAYSLGYKAQYDFSEFNYVFGLVDWNKDKFSGYDQQVSEAVGYGRRVINNERHVLNLELGAGARQSDLRDGTSQTEGVIRGGLDYAWQLSETAEFTQDFVVEVGDENTYLESVTALRARILADIALVASYTIKQNTDVPIGSEKTDTFAVLSLEYAF
ncbi:MAG: DUF481 domain-containing protein [Gammaproteobacteria bacterium]